jgi:SAM-dependent methyltransferase
VTAPERRRADASPFDELYASDTDPWQVRSSWYERRKLAVLLASLPRERYRHGLEIGCSIGVTTRALTARCDHVTALDASPRALALARAELGPLVGDRVELAEATVPEQLPEVTYDLLVLSEVGYFIEPQRVAVLADALPHRLTVGGDLVAVHWRQDADSLATPGDEVHARLAVPGLRELVSHSEREFVLQVWRRET